MGEHVRCLSLDLVQSLHFAFEVPRFYITARSLMLQSYFTSTSFPAQKQIRMFAASSSCNIDQVDVNRGSVYCNRPRNSTNRAPVPDEHAGCTSPGPVIVNRGPVRPNQSPFTETGAWLAQTGPRKLQEPGPPRLLFSGPAFELGNRGQTGQKPGRPG